jgi:hypothetical protein
MPAARAGGIDFKSLGDFPLLRMVAKQVLRQWAADDIPRANETNSIYIPQINFLLMLGSRPMFKVFSSGMHISYHTLLLRIGSLGIAVLKGRYGGFYHGKSQRPSYLIVFISKYNVIIMCCKWLFPFPDRLQTVTTDQLRLSGLIVVSGSSD